MSRWKVAVVLSAVFASHAYSQGRESSLPSITSGVNVQRTVLDVSKPQLIQDVDGGSTVRRFDCEKDGSIVTLIDGYSRGTGNTRLALVGIHPDGTVTNFQWRSVAGFRSISYPKSVFVGHGHVYVLADARTSSPQGDQETYAHIVLVFNQQGGLEQVISLKTNSNPLGLGVFPSRKLLIISESKSDQRMAVMLFSSNGEFIRDILTNVSEYVMRESGLSPASHVIGNYSPELLISLIEVVPSGDHLLLVPLETSKVPIDEVDENEVVNSVIPHLPDNTILDSFISSDATSFKIQAGHLLKPYQAVDDSQGKALGIPTSPGRIIEISHKDGSILRELELSEPELQPACEADGVFQILHARSVGSWQVLSAQAR